MSEQTCSDLVTEVCAFLDDVPFVHVARALESVDRDASTDVERAIVLARSLPELAPARVAGAVRILARVPVARAELAGELVALRGAVRGLLRRPELRRRDGRGWRLVYAGATPVSVWMTEREATALLQAFADGRQPELAPQLPLVGVG